MAGHPFLVLIVGLADDGVGEVLPNLFNVEIALLEISKSRRHILVTKLIFLIFV